jgi:hypothetical protein
LTNTARASKYAKCSTEDFDRLLAEVLENEDIVENGAASRLLTIPGVYEVLSEHFNNAVLELWELEQAAEAMPAAECSDSPACAAAGCADCERSYGPRREG